MATPLLLTALLLRAALAAWPMALHADLSQDDAALAEQPALGRQEHLAVNRQMSVDDHILPDSAAVTEQPDNCTVPDSAALTEQPAFGNQPRLHDRASRDDGALDPWVLPGLVPRGAVASEGGPVVHWALGQSTPGGQSRAGPTGAVRRSPSTGRGPKGASLTNRTSSRGCIYLNVECPKDHYCEANECWPNTCKKTGDCPAPKYCSNAGKCIIDFPQECDTLSFPKKECPKGFYCGGEKTCICETWMDPRIISCPKGFTCVEGHCK